MGRGLLQPTEAAAQRSSSNVRASSRMMGMDFSGGSTSSQMASRTGEVELICGPGGQKLDVPVNGVPGGAGSEVKAPV